MKSREIIEVTLNGGRGSGAVLASHIEAFQASGDCVTSVSTQPAIMPEVTQVPIEIGDRPMPIHDFLPVTPNAVTVSSLSPDEFDFYDRQFRTGIKAAVDQAARNRRDPLLFAHHANVQLVAAAEVAESMGVPLMTMPHGTDIGGYEENGNVTAYNNKLPGGETWGRIRHGLNRAAAVIAISRFMQETQINPHVDDPTKIHVISNPLPKDVENASLQGHGTNILEELIREGAIRNGRYLLQVGILKEWKLPLHLAEATHGLPDGIQTLFVGADSDGLASRVVAEGKNCIYLGPRSRKQTQDLMHGAAALVVSSFDEPFGLTPIEAGAFGTPAVVRPSGAPPEFIHDGYNGIVAADLSVASLALAIRRALTTPPELQGYDLSRYTREQFGSTNTSGRVVALTHSFMRD